MRHDDFVHQHLCAVAVLCKAQCAFSSSSTKPSAIGAFIRQSGSYSPIPANALHLKGHRHPPNNALTKHNAVILVDTTHDPGESQPPDDSRCIRTLRPQAMSKPCRRIQRIPTSNMRCIVLQEDFLAPIMMPCIGGLSCNFNNRCTSPHGLLLATCLIGTAWFNLVLTLYRTLTIPGSHVVAFPTVVQARVFDYGIY